MSNFAVGNRTGAVKFPPYMATHKFRYAAGGYARDNKAECRQIAVRRKTPVFRKGSGGKRQAGDFGIIFGIMQR